MILRRVYISLWAILSILVGASITGITKEVPINIAYFVIFGGFMVLLDCAVVKRINNSRRIIDCQH